MNSPITIYVELLDEGTDTWRPTKAIELGDGLFKLLPTPNYDPENESWAFLPGETVKAEQKKFAKGHTEMVARHPDVNVIRIHVEQTGVETPWLKDAFARKLEDGLYQMLPTPHYNPTEDYWKFPPGTIVRLKEMTSAGFKFLVADVA